MDVEKSLAYMLTYLPNQNNNGLPNWYCRINKHYCKSGKTLLSQGRLRVLVLRYKFHSESFSPKSNNGFLLWSIGTWHV